METKIYKLNDKKRVPHAYAETRKSNDYDGQIKLWICNVIVGRTARKDSLRALFDLIKSKNKNRHLRLGTNYDNFAMLAGAIKNNFKIIGRDNHGYILEFQ